MLLQVQTNGNTLVVAKMRNRPFDLTDNIHYWVECNFDFQLTLDGRGLFILSPQCNINNGVARVRRLITDPLDVIKRSKNRKFATKI